MDKLHTVCGGQQCLVCLCPAQRDGCRVFSTALPPPIEMKQEEKWDGKMKYSSFHRRTTEPGVKEDINPQIDDVDILDTEQSAI